MFHLKPENDGVDHINVYSKGKTNLGRMLTNFYRHPVKIGEYGVFYTLEGFWYWLWSAEIIRHYQVSGFYTFDIRIEGLRNDLMTIDGYLAKQVGREIIALLPDAPMTEPTEEFKQVFCNAIKLKIATIPELSRAFIESYPKPLFHYYVYGKPPMTKVVFPKNHAWLLEFLNDYRDTLAISQGADPALKSDVTLYKHL